MTPDDATPRDLAILHHQKALEHDGHATIHRVRRDAAIANWKEHATLAEIAAVLDISDAAVHHAIARHNARTPDP